MSDDAEANGRAWLALAGGKLGDANKAVLGGLEQNGRPSAQLERARAALEAAGKAVSYLAKAELMLERAE